ncbi:hypothetical protein HH214_05670 [Mucilaginibacter robiniae]|uniref:Transcriptional regulator n=1 Tax=Mucilaginibacter robiniae TaxID=2728022 RepID=A0A7L5E4Z7_9SPHI|nr:hypothetical protein [Mucilaginibacter robiniae]QJD95396.1 hypothetical protein HH214_05670 [Mucilaginibacter robiniae]
MTPEMLTLVSLYAKITEDPRVSVWHISLYTSILTLWQKGGCPQELRVSRKQLMTGAHFRSITTYHKCINQLRKLEYIEYFPNYDAYQRSIIKLII